MTFNLSKLKNTEGGSDEILRNLAEMNTFYFNQPWKNEIGKEVLKESFEVLAKYYFSNSVEIRTKVVTIGLLLAKGFVDIYEEFVRILIQKVSSIEALTECIEQIIFLAKSGGCNSLSQSCCLLLFQHMTTYVIAEKSIFWQITKALSNLYSLVKMGLMNSVVRNAFAKRKQDFSRSVSDSATSAPASAAASAAASASASAQISVSALTSDSTSISYLPTEERDSSWSFQHLIDLLAKFRMLLGSLMMMKDDEHDSIVSIVAQKYYVELDDGKFFPENALPPWVVLTLSIPQTPGSQSLEETVRMSFEEADEEDRKSVV